MDLGLQGKAALVTGGSRGIGKAIARALAHEGARVCVAARGKADLEAAAKELGQLGPPIASVQAYVTTQDGARAAVQAALDAFGALDVLVNNVGGSGGARSFDLATAEQWKKVVDANLLAAVWCSQTAGEWMKSHGGGAIVHISSIFGREYASSAPYGRDQGRPRGARQGDGRRPGEAPHPRELRRPRLGALPGRQLGQAVQDSPELVARMLREELPWGRFGSRGDRRGRGLRLLRARELGHRRLHPG
jgi:3-oxoacyl-[acyl-carrier protein] reductase